MKTYTVYSHQATAGIVLDKNSDAISVGEEGRGRKLVRVPVPQGGTVENGTLISVPAREGEENAAVVLIRDHSGYRGSWRVRDALTHGEWDTVLAVPMPEGVHPDSLMAKKIRRELEDGYYRPARWRVIAEGQCAQGDAGRMGGGPEYLAVLLDGQAIEAICYGRLYGKEYAVKIQNVEGDVVITFPKKEAESRKEKNSWK